MRRLRMSSATKSPQPASASVSRDRRVIDRSSELKSSARTAHDAPRSAIMNLGRNPAASMIGNRYKKPSDTYGLVHQSTAAIVSRIAPLTARTGTRWGASHIRSKRGIQKILPLADGAVTLEDS